MNILFAAQKESVVVDVCSLSSRSSAVLQQACDITGGIYVDVDRIDALLQYMLVQ
jgi:transcription initiation factor TFIIH subunit 3